MEPIRIYNMERKQKARRLTKKKMKKKDRNRYTLPCWNDFVRGNNAFRPTQTKSGTNRKIIRELK